MPHIRQEANPACSNSTTDCTCSSYHTSFDRFQYISSYRQIPNMMTNDCITSYRQKIFKLIRKNKHRYTPNTSHINGTTAIEISNSFQQRINYLSGCHQRISIFSQFIVWRKALNFSQTFPLFKVYIQNKTIYANIRKNKQHILRYSTK